jgi:hypothetical protein
MEKGYHSRLGAGESRSGSSSSDRGGAAFEEDDAEEYASEPNEEPARAGFEEEDGEEDASEQDEELVVMDQRRTMGRKVTRRRTMS